MTDRLSDLAKDVARETNDHPVVRAMARIGYAASGLMHLLIGWVAIGIGLKTSGGRATADQSGPFTEISRLPLGNVLLWVMVVGFAGLALWQLTETIGGWHGTGREAAGSRIKAFSKAVVYAVLAFGSLNFARGGGASSRTQSASATATLLDQPGGRILVVVVGLVVVGVGVYHVFKGLRKTFLDDLVGHPGTLAERAGMMGYAAKGDALVMVGVLLAAAGVQGNAGPSRGLDGALRAFAGTSGGTRSCWS